MELIVTPSGVVKFIYDEAVDLHALGVLEIRRVSSVEPDVAGIWWADMSPVGGQRLGPFSLRSQALRAEVDWLRHNVLASSDTTTGLPVLRGAAFITENNGCVLCSLLFL